MELKIKTSGGFSTREIGVPSGDLGSPDSSLDNQIAVADGTTGKLIAYSPATVDDNGSINIPTGQQYKINNTPINKSDVGLGNVDNTSDATKNSAAATLTNKTINADDNTISNIEVDNFKSGVLDTDLSDVSTNHDTLPSAKATKTHIDNQEITQATFNTSDGVLTLTKTDGNITVDLDGRYIPLGSIDADTITISNIELDNFKTSAIVTQSEGITSNDNDTTIPTSSAVKDYVDNAVIPDTNTFVNGASFDTTTRVLTLSLNNSTSLTVNIPGGALSNLVEDATPQLGGSLDLNSNNITGTGNISITGYVTASRFNGNFEGKKVISCKSEQALTGGDPVYISGYDSTQAKPLVSLAQSGVNQAPYGIQKMPCVGLALASVSSGSSVSIVISGELTGINTSSFNVGDTLYVADYQDSTTLTDTPPTDATSSDYSLIQAVGIVSKSATSGTILVQINKPNELPNLDYNEVIIGDANNQPEKRQLTKSDVGLANVPNINSADGSNITSGTVADARLSTNVTLQGNTFNGANQLIKADSSGKLPAVDGSLLTNLSSGSDFIYSDTFSGASDTTVVNDSYIQIRYHSSSKQFQYFPKASASWGWVDGGFIYSRGSNHTVKGDSGNIKNATNQSWTYIGFSGVYDAQYNLNNYGTQIIAFLVKDTYSSSHPAYIIHAGCGSNTSIFCTVQRVGP